MRALVLTFDRYRAITLHMIAAYREKWPDHPLRFRIPYQAMAIPGADEAELVRTPPGIKPTMMGLLDGLADDEWVYWCIDDKYPIEVDAAALPRTAEWVAGIEDPQIAGILICRCRKLLSTRFLTGHVLTGPDGGRFLERSGYEQIWIHQFLRVKVLRHIFASFPDEIPNAKEMDFLIKAVAKPAGHRLFVAEKNMAVFGESASRGLLTENCHASILRRGLPLPEFFQGQLAPAITMGTL